MTTDLRARRGRIFLTGFMGSGKSTVGPILANSIGYSFVDLDRLIEQRNDKSVKRIFQEDGEQFFRGEELAVLEELATKDKMVVALGGGTLAEPEAFQSVNRSGILVYLKVPPEELLKRLQHKTDRPLLMDAEREPVAGGSPARADDGALHQQGTLYERADVIVLADEQRLGLTVDHLVRMLMPVLS